ncbi:hypothetical protein C8J56DRAFT_329162 [Mycena floridula]|nr:hypothetical protein C8J56DRAFT_329162 [Mycena floridula]
MFLFFVAVLALCSSFASSKSCWDTVAPANAGGISSPNETSVLVTNQEYTIVWDPSYFSNSSTEGPAGHPLEKGDGLIYFDLYQYVPQLGSDSQCHPNYSAVLASIAHGIENSGELKWTPPHTLEIGANYLISGYDQWTEEDLFTGFGTAMFSIKHSLTDLITPSSDTLHSIEAAVQSTLSASLSSYWAAESSSQAAASARRTAYIPLSKGARVVRDKSWIMLVSVLSGVMVLLYLL